MTPMRVLVCGGRDYADRAHVRFTLAVWPISDSTMPKGAKGIRWDIRDAAKVDALTIVHGAAKGADSLAGEIAHDLGYRVVAHPADWATHGKAAGPIRNKAMLDTGVDLVVAFPGGRGTAHMVSIARKAGVPVFEA